jgi:hypothetical protein
MPYTSSGKFAYAVDLDHTDNSVNKLFFANTHGIAHRASYLRAVQLSSHSRKSDHLDPPSPVLIHISSNMFGLRMLKPLLPNAML